MFDMRALLQSLIRAEAPHTHYSRRAKVSRIDLALQWHNADLKPHRKHKCEWPGCNYSNGQRSNVATHRNKQWASQPFLLCFTLMALRRRYSTGERPYLCLNGGCKATFTSPYELSHHRSKCKCPTEIEGQDLDYEQTDDDSYYATTAAESQTPYAPSSPAVSTATTITLAEPPETYHLQSSPISAAHIRGSWGLKTLNKTTFELSDPSATIDYPLSMDKSHQRTCVNADTTLWSAADFAPRTEVSSREHSSPLPLPTCPNGWDGSSKSLHSSLPREAATAGLCCSLARNGDVQSRLPEQPADHEYDQPEVYMTRSNTALTRSARDCVIPLPRSSSRLAYAIQDGEAAPDYQLPGVQGISDGQYPPYSVEESPLPARLEAVKMLPGYTYPPPARLDGL